MSYDLLLRQQSPGSVARDDSEGGRLRPGDVSIERALLAPAAGLAAAAALILIAASRPGRRKIERTYYRATWRDLKTTRETPSQTMRELVYGRKGDE